MYGQRSQPKVEKQPYSSQNSVGNMCHIMGSLHAVLGIEPWPPTYTRWIEPSLCERAASHCPRAGAYRSKVCAFPPAHPVRTPGTTRLTAQATISSGHCWMRRLKTKTNQQSKTIQNTSSLCSQASDTALSHHHQVRGRASVERTETEPHREGRPR